MKTPGKSSRRSQTHAPSAVDRAEAHIRADIQVGRLRPGQHLTEALLTRNLGLSRGPIREAIRRLEAEGVLDAKIHRGVTVNKITRDELVDILEIREVLEGLAGRLAARNDVGNPVRAELTRLHLAMRDAVQNNDVERYNLQLYAQFHELIVDAAHNPKLRRLWDQLHLKTFQLQLRPLIDLELVKRSHKDHKPLVAAILRRDPIAAEQAMRRHIAHFIRHVTHLPDSVFDGDERPSAKYR